MADKKSILFFKASAHLQRLIGRELVPNAEMAVIEHVKNAYDAGANQVRITIQLESAKEPGSIEIDDDGHGMTVKDIEQLFMFAGYSNRPSQRVRGRVPTGEKGIGIFASDKLGKRLSVFSKRENQEDGVHLNINWEDFRNRKKEFGEISAPLTVGPIPGFTRKTRGTRLLITQLRQEWTENTLNSLRKKLSELLNPFARIDDFKIELTVVGSSKLSGPIKSEKPGPTDLLLHFKILKDGTTERTVTEVWDETDVKKTILPFTERTKKLAGLNGRLFYSMRRPPKEVRKGLDPGVRLYRDGFRIEPFGSPSGDWLGISEKRAKRHGHAHIVPSRIFGFIEIFKQYHADLVDTTSRQSLIDGEEARGLVAFLRDQVDFLEDKIKTERAIPRWEKTRKEKTRKLLEARYQTLSSASLGLAHELRQPLLSMQLASDNIENYLMSSAVAIPEVNNAASVIRRSIERIDKHVQFMKNIGAGREDIETFSLAGVVNEVVDAFKERAAARNIKLVSHVNDSLNVRFNRWALLTTLTNLVLNSFEAFEESGPESHAIQFVANKTKKGITISIEDDGPGIPPEARSRLFRHHTTNKSGGMGVALLVSLDTMKLFGGELSCTSYSDPTRFEILIPKELKNGADSRS